MSYCAIIEFTGNGQKISEFHNAWGGAARIFAAMHKRYIPTTVTHESWSMFPEKLWALTADASIPIGQRAVLASTYDLAYVKRADFGRFATDLRMFAEVFPVQPNAVDHLYAWADVIEASLADKVGFIGTSVSGSTWTLREVCPCCEQDTDESRDYDFSKDTGAFDVYDSLTGEAPNG